MKRRCYFPYCGLKNKEWRGDGGGDGQWSPLSIFPSVPHSSSSSRETISLLFFCSPMDQDHVHDYRLNRSTDPIPNPFSGTPLNQLEEQRMKRRCNFPYCGLLGKDKAGYHCARHLLWTKWRGGRTKKGLQEKYTFLPRYLLCICSRTECFYWFCLFVFFHRKFFRGDFG